MFLLGGQCTIRINPEGATCDLGSLVDETRTGARLHVPGLLHSSAGATYRGQRNGDGISKIGRKMIDLDLRCTIYIIMSFVRSA